MSLTNHIAARRDFEKTNEPDGEPAGPRGRQLSHSEA